MAHIWDCFFRLMWCGFRGIKTRMQESQGKLFGLSAIGTLSQTAEPIASGGDWSERVADMS